MQPGRVWVDCASCKRSRRYRVANLLDWFGPDISTLDLLRHLTASCRYQRADFERWQVDGEEWITLGELLELALRLGLVAAPRRLQ
jgi:hypothetical protein